MNEGGRGRCTCWGSGGGGGGDINDVYFCLACHSFENAEASLISTRKRPSRQCSHHEL
jgi:hypothetical protein